MLVCTSGTFVMRSTGGFGRGEGVPDLIFSRKSALDSIPARPFSEA